jgi:hypothetical protein
MRPARFVGKTETQIIYTCCAEACVGFVTARDVLFRGKEPRSNAAVRVAHWAAQNNMRLRKLEAVAREQFTPRDVEDSLTRAEAALASRVGK